MIVRFRGEKDKKSEMRERERESGQRRRGRSGWGEEGGGFTDLIWFRMLVV